MKALSVKFFISITIAILSLPLVLSVLRIKVIPQNELEKKITFNFTRNFPLKEDLFKIYSYFKKEIIGTNILPDSVIETHDGWMFLGDKFSNAFSESKGLIIFSELELQRLKASLLKKKNWTDKQGIQLYISMAPNKLSVYGNKIDIKRGKVTKLEQLESVCKEIDVPFIKLGKYFNSAGDKELYLRTDSHWNNLGGYYAYKATIDAFSQKYKDHDFSEINDEDKTIYSYQWSEIGDLNKALEIFEYEQFVSVKYHGQLSFKQVQNKWKAPSGYPFLKDLYEERYISNANDLKVVVLRDSFFGGYYHLIANSFGESVFIWRHFFNKTLLLEESPDILLYEIAERNIDLLLEDEFKGYFP